ncbi:MAG: hypothetical protein WC438_00310 [Candidatus Pacearchaeota archaeon]
MAKRFDRKAWIKIVEAFLAILIISTALLVILSEQPKKIDNSEDIYLLQRQILEIISKNNSLREDVLGLDYAPINNTIRKMLSPAFDFDTKICDLKEICNPSNLPTDKDVYSTEIVITATLTQYQPQKLRFFVWGK